MRISIRYQLLLPLVTLMLGLVGASAWSAYASGRHARAMIEKQIHDIAMTVHSTSFPLKAQTLHLMKGISGAEFLLCDANRQPLRDSLGRLTTSTLDQVPIELPAPTAPDAANFNTAVQIENTSYLCAGLHPGGRSDEILYVLYPESLWRDAVWQALRPALLLGFLGGLVAILLSALLLQNLGSRVGELERRTRMIAAGDFSPMPLPWRNDELRDLARSVNDMAQKLAQFQETMRRSERLRLLGQVSGGLAHQLRNGVAGARLAVQLHAQDCKATADREALDVALRQLALVEMHLKRFLNLGKAIELARQPCRLDDILRDTIALVGPQCRHAGIDLRVATSEQPLPLVGDADQLGQVILNLITNAVEAAGPRGWIEVRSGVSVSAASVFIEVRDSGAGPPAEVAARLFEPFVTGKPEGVGLGLAVARQVVEAHGGSIRWLRDGAATCFRIELPMVEADRT